ncbi:unnamed protein product [Allacma fusca]|uniref:Glycine-rich protein n=1 Tax=Allacma fusca TaxID=39272 RepID=A0A8J2NIQ5_9HEXA|nr:unnamed protein product [Allacma fusca]
MKFIISLFLIALIVVYVSGTEIDPVGADKEENPITEVKQHQRKAKIQKRGLFGLGYGYGVGYGYGYPGFYGGWGYPIGYGWGWGGYGYGYPYYF